MAHTKRLVQLSEGMRAALITGASSGIGLALARMLVEEGHAVTLVARDVAKLEAAASSLAAGAERVAIVSGDLADEDVIRKALACHHGRFGRLDVLVNSAGVGFGGPIQALSTRKLDLQLSLNVRTLALMYRECAPLLTASGGEHGAAVVMNLASIAGKQGAAGFAAYSATKAAIVGFTQAMNRELGASGVKSTALCPAFVDTPMTDFVKGQVPPERMIRTSDIAEAGRLLLRLSPNCLIPELLFTTRSGTLDIY